MFRITKLADYSLVVLSHFAMRLNDVLSSCDIVSATNIPKPMASKILKLLTQNGLLKSIRGAKGGYVFCKKPDEVSVADVIRIFEGQIAVTECNSSENSCSLARSCNLRLPWKQVNKAVAEILGGVTLADLTVGYFDTRKRIY